MTRIIDPDSMRAGALLAWYDRHARVLPWRIGPAARRAGAVPDPYRVWLSEIMLQQTTVRAVAPYFEAFLLRWPTVADLASADADAVMSAWAGLGYYSRARNLKACAEAVVRDHGGAFPSTEEGLRALPGIGAYTAAAIAAIAFDRPAAVVDGNVERVVSRLEAIDMPLPLAKSSIRAHVAAMVPVTRPGDFAQAMMDLGATICTPRNPACALCPVNEGCRARLTGDPARFPVRLAKPDKPLRRGAAFVAVRHDGAVLLRKRAETGLLGGMAEPFSTAFSSRADGGMTVADAPFPARWRAMGSIRHVFTHFELDLAVFRTDGPFPDLSPGWWWSTDIHSEALPTVMKKAIEAALNPTAPKTRARRQKDR